MSTALVNNAVVRYLKEVRAEIRKVTWPDRPEVLRLTGIVLVVLVIMSAFLAILDFGFAQLMSVVLRLGSGQ